MRWTLALCMCAAGCGETSWLEDAVACAPELLAMFDGDTNERPLRGAVITREMTIRFEDCSSVQSTTFDLISTTVAPREASDGVAPFHLLSDAEGNAVPIDARLFPDASYYLLATGTRFDATDVTLTADFALAHGGEPELAVSPSPGRTDLRPLANATLDGEAYIVLLPGTLVGITAVRFTLDGDTMQERVERLPPYDFVSTASDQRLTLARPFDPTTAGTGPHTLTAVIEQGSGTNQEITAQFLVP